jgi:hypothetical protein
MSIYDKLADAAEQGRLHPVEGTETTGADATAAAAADLITATGSVEVELAVTLAIGRPRLGEERGPSPMWRVRATPELHAAVQELADRRGETVSTVVRQAVRAYLENTSATRGSTHSPQEHSDPNRRVTAKREDPDYTASDVTTSGRSAPIR